MYECLTNLTKIKTGKMLEDENPNLVIPWQLSYHNTKQLKLP